MGAIMPTRLQSIVLVLSLLFVLTACVQTTLSPLPTPTPVRTIDLPETLVSSRWTLREITVSGQEVDVEPIRPVYLTITPAREQPNSLRVEFQSECYENQESPRRDGYIAQFSASNRFALISEEHTANQCDPQRQPATARFARLRRTLTSYAMEDGILILRGTDESSGEEIVMRWERSPMQ